MCTQRWKWFPQAHMTHGAQAAHPACRGDTEQHGALIRSQACLCPPPEAFAPWYTRDPSQASALASPDVHPAILPTPLESMQSPVVTGGPEPWGCNVALDTGLAAGSRREQLFIPFPAWVPVPQLVHVSSIPTSPYPDKCLSRYCSTSAQFRLTALTGRIASLSCSDPKHLQGTDTMLTQPICSPMPALH